MRGAAPDFPPLIVKAKYDSSGPVFPAFLNEVQNTTSRAKREFESTFREIGTTANQALASIGRGQLFDIPGLRKTAADADHTLQRLTAMRDAASRLAKETGDTSIETARYNQALRAQVIEAEQAKRAADAQVQTYTRLQAEIDQTVASNERLRQSWRDTFAEQARSANQAHGFQGAINSVFAAGLTRRATDNGAGFGALAEAADYADRAEAMRRALDPAHAAQARFNVEMAEAKTLVSAGALSLDEYCAKLRQERQVLDQSTAAGMRHAAMSGQQRIGLQQLSMQIGDMATMYALGANGSQIFASQAGQVIQAISLMGNGTSKFASFMMGPWGAALTAGTLVLTPFIAKMFDSETAIKGAALASDGLSNAQGVMGEMFDLTTGRISRQNDMLRLNIQLTSMNLRAEAIAAKGRADAATLLSGRPSMMISVGEMLAQSAGAAPMPRGPQPKTLARAMLEGVSKGEIQGSDAMIWAQKADFSRSGISQKEFIAGLTAAVEARAKGETADKIDQSLASGVLNKDFMRPGSKRKGSSGDKGLTEWGEGTAEKIARITDQFNEQPKAIDRAAQATRQLDDIMKDLAARKPKGFADMISEAEAAKGTIIDSLVRPFQDLEESSQRRLRAQALSAQGYGAEATALQQIWQIEDRLGSEEEIRARIVELTAKGRKSEAAALESLVSKYPALKQQVLEQARAEEQVNEAMKRREALMGSYLSATRSARQEVEAILAGEGSFGNFQQIFKRLNAQVITEQLFGSMFDDLDRWAKRNTPLGRVTTDFMDSTNRAGTAALDLADVLKSAADSIRGIDGVGKFSSSLQQGANDNPSENLALAQLRSYFDTTLTRGTGAGGDIEVSNRATGQPAKPVDVRIPANTLMGMSPDVYMARLSERLGVITGRELDRVLGTQFMGKLTGAMSGAFYGNAVGGMPGTILGALGGIEGVPAAIDQIFGKDKLSAKFDEAFGQSGISDALSGMGTGSMISGLANSLGLKMSKTGSQIGGAIGSVIPGVGSVIGSIAGGIIGSLFSSPKWATSVASGGNTSSAGNKSDWRSSTGEAADSINSAISDIADRLDGKVGDYLVSLGLNDGHWHVSTTGRSGRLRGNQGWQDVVDYGENQQAAFEAAIKDAIADGGIILARAGSNMLLKMAKSVDQGVQDVQDFESIFSRLKGFKDPLGARLDTLDKEFARFRELAISAGEGLAEAEELYGLERKKIVEEVNSQILGSLRSFRDELLTGDSGLSLRTRQTNARGIFDPLAARVAAGDTGAFDDFTASARTLLDITRQIDGSQAGYFSLFDQVNAITKAAIDRQNALLDQATSRDSPFSTSAVPTTDNSAVVSAIDAQTKALLSGLGAHLEAMNRNMGTLIEQGIAANSNGGAAKFDMAGNW